MRDRTPDDTLNILGRQANRHRARWWLALQTLIIIDVVLILISIFFDLPADWAFYFHVFDLLLCLALLIEWGYRLYTSKPKKSFLRRKSNWIDLIASIPFDVIVPLIFPQAGLMIYLKILRGLRILVLIERIFHSITRFLEKTYLDKILSGVVVIIIFFTLLMYYYGPSYGLFDDFYFVIVTLTTVGYGDVIPQTFNEKVIALILITFGILVFSSITAGISSYLTDRLLSKEEKDITNVIEDNVKTITDELDEIKKDLEVSHRENRELRDEIRELKEMIKKE